MDELDLANQAEWITHQSITCRFCQFIISQDRCASISDRHAALLSLSPGLISKAEPFE